MAKSEKITLVIQDAANRSKLTFDSWDEARNHIRMVILGQIIDEIAELALQDDPSKYADSIKELQEIAQEVNYPRDEEALRDAVSAWDDYTDHAVSFTTIEII